MIYTHSDGTRLIQLIYGKQKFKKKDRIVFSMDGSHFPIPMEGVTEQFAQNGVLLLVEKIRKKKNFAVLSVARLRALAEEGRAKKRSNIYIRSFNGSGEIKIPLPAAARWVESIAAHEMRR